MRRCHEHELNTNFAVNKEGRRVSFASSEVFDRDSLE